MDGIRNEISRCLSGVNVNPTRDAPKEKTCWRCGGAGVIAVPYTNGWEGTHYVACPECEPQIRSQIYNRASGISSDAYKRYTLESFRADTPTAQKMMGKAERYIRDSKALLKNGKGLAFWGSPGNGKTHLCIAVLQKLNTAHIYWQYRREIQRIKNAMYRDEAEYARLMGIAKTRSVLYIDDLFKAGFQDGGGIKSQDDEIMFDIINERYLKRYPTFFSSEYTLAEIGEWDEALSSRIWDMVTPYTMEVRGENRRIEGS